MNTAEQSHGPDEPAGVGEQNIARLVGEAYQPESADPAFVRQVTEKLYQVAAELAEARVPLRPLQPDRLQRLRWRLTLVMTAAAAAAGIALFLHAWFQAPGPRPAIVAAPEPAVESRLARLTPRPRPEAPAVQTAKVGDVVATPVGQRRRLGLPDGSIAYLNERTQLKLDADRQLTVRAGEVFLEVTPRQPGAEDAMFVVQTPTRKVHALGTKFAIKADAPGTEVVVTQGKVLCCPLPSEFGQLVVSGQQLMPPEPERQVFTDTVSPAPRASHVLDWTRDLMAAAESPLVPASQYCGGALVAVDPSGQQAQLSLRKYHIDVHIEDGFARTTIDQTYFNHNTARMEGTFYFPLPPDASLSRLAMYVANGDECTLNEGGMADREHARTVFETIVSRQKDPALLEWIDGSTFKMRVFPLEGRQEKRIILSYTQRLPGLYGRMQYRFPAGHNLEGVREWQFHARVKAGAGLSVGSTSHPFEISRKGGDLFLDAAEKNARINKDVEMSLYDAATTGETVRFSSAEHENSRYVMVRYRPQLSTRYSVPSTRRRDWVFLFESAADRDPLLARAQVDIVHNLLTNSEPDDTFVILTAGAEVQPFDRTARPATPENVKAAIAFLDRAHLVGALDLDKALSAAQPYLQGKNPCLVHVGGGLPVLGERREDVLVKRLAENVPYVGVGVGKRWARSFMKAAAERTGGHFTQINPDEPIAWRSFELLATLNTPRLMNLQVVDEAEKAVFLPYATSVAQGEELCAISRLPQGAALPQSLTIHGTLDGQAFDKTVPVAQVAAKADYLPRTWAKLEIDRLLAADSQQNKPQIVELSKAMYVMTPFTSLLVLENDAMYEQYKVDRGRKDHWALYSCPAKVPVVYEPASTVAKTTPPAGQKLTVEELADSVLVRPSPSVVVFSQQVPTAGSRVLAGLHFRGAYGLPVATLIDQSGPMLWMDLENKALGLDPDMPSNYSLYFLKDVNAPGVITFSAPASGVISGPTGMPMSLPLPVISGGTAASTAPAVDNGRFINYAPVFVSPTMQWTAPSLDFGWQAGATNPFNWPPGFGAYYGRGTGIAGSPVSQLMATDPGLLGLRLKRAAEAGSGWPGPTSREAMRLAASLDGTVRLWDWRERTYNERGGRISNPVGRHKLRIFPDGRLAERGDDTRRSLVEWYRSRLMFGGDEQPSIDDLMVGDFTTDRNWRFTGLGRFMPTILNLDANRNLASSPDGGLLMTGDYREGLINLNTIWDRESFDALTDYYWKGRQALTPSLLVLDPYGREDDRRKARVLNRANFGLGFSNLLYSRPRFSNDDRLFTDLLAYAPGMNSSAADLEAVLDAEAAADPADAPGTIEPAARALIDRARQIGWQKLTLDNFAVTFDGAGRYRYERTTADGLREQVVCDGQTLWHLYPDLGVGARRTVSRFHRAELSRWLPQVLPPADELARGFDLKVVGERTVALVPRDVDPKKHLRLNLYFAEDGRLTERRLASMPEEKTLQRVILNAGIVQVVNDRNEQVVYRHGTPADARAPELKPDTDGLLVLSLPYRSKDHVVQRYKLDPSLSKLPTETEPLLALLGVAVSQRDTQLATWALQQLTDSGRREQPLGLYTILASCGLNMDALPHGPGLRTRFPRQPLATYLAMHSNPEAARHCDQWQVPAGDTLLQRLTAFRALYQRWQKGDAHFFTDVAGRQAEQMQALDFIRRNRSALGWALLDQVENRISKDAAGQEAIAAVWLELADVPGLGYAARYEHARSLWLADKKDQARQRFEELYERALLQGVLPTLDAAFRQALQTGGDSDRWTALMRRTAERLTADKRRLAAVALAWQCRYLGDSPVGDAVLDIAVAGVESDPQRLAVTLPAVEFLWQAGKLDRADALVQSLLADATLGKEPSLWRLAALVASQRQQPERVVAGIEKALDLEFRDLPETINVEAIRQDYGPLLDQYAEAAVKLSRGSIKARRELAARVVQAADRWRSLETDVTVPSRKAARILAELGEAKLAWEYLTTPLVQQAGSDGAAQVSLGDLLPGEGEAVGGNFDLRASDAAERYREALGLARAGRRMEAAELLTKGRQ